VEDVALQCHSIDSEDSRLRRRVTAWVRLGASLTLLGSFLADARPATAQSVSGGLPPVASIPPSGGTVTALGRLSPRDGVVRVAGPSEPVIVIGKLLARKGDWVKEGQVIAQLDRMAVRQAGLVPLQAELDSAEAELQRSRELHSGEVVSDSVFGAQRLAVDIARARLNRARAELELALVRAPIEGEVLEIHARDGERVGPEGIVEIGRTDQMYAIAEVFETDIGKVELGQTATVSSAALPQPLTGSIEWINRKVGKMDVLGTDPAARTDARVVEVEIRLDDSIAAAGLTNLQVEVVIAP